MTLAQRLAREFPCIWSTQRWHSTGWPSTCPVCGHTRVAIEAAVVRAIEACADRVEAGAGWRFGPALRKYVLDLLTTDTDTETP